MRRILFFQEEDCPHPRFRPRTCRLGSRTHLCRKGYGQSPARSKDGSSGLKEENGAEVQRFQTLIVVLRFSLSPKGKTPLKLSGVIRESKSNYEQMRIGIGSFRNDFEIILISPYPSGIQLMDISFRKQSFPTLPLGSF